MITPGIIESWRKSKGWTKKELAERMGITYPFLVNILNGKREISSTTIAKFKLLRGEERGDGIDAVRAFAVRLTPQEYHKMCAMAGAENLTAEEAEAAVRELLQKTWDSMASSVPQVVQSPPPEYGESAEPFA